MKRDIRNQKVLIVDDIPENIDILMAALWGEHKLVPVRSGEKALVLANSSIPPDLILLDIMMPGMDGYEVCRKLKSDKKTKNIPIIFITARGEISDETKGLEYGAVDYITKPISPPIVKARVRNHLELKIAREELENQNEILELKVKERTREIKETQKETLVRLTNASELRDTDTGMHIRRIQEYTEALAKALGKDKRYCEGIGLASTMHDLGKIGIPDSVLLKPGKLSGEEWLIMKTHPAVGAKILEDSSSRLLQEGALISLHHHEKWDGTGYPAGLKGNEISIEGRIVGIVDVFDALTTRRPYKRPWPIDKAVHLIEEESGSHFDPEMVTVFRTVLPEILSIKESYNDTSACIRNGVA